jgi:hypothetical protein
MGDTNRKPAEKDAADATSSAPAEKELTPLERITNELTHLQARVDRALASLRAGQIGDAITTLEP